MYQRIKLAKLMSPSWARTKAVGSSSSTSRARANFFGCCPAGEGLGFSMDEVLTMVQRMVAMYPIEPSARRLGRIVAIDAFPSGYMTFM